MKKQAPKLSARERNILYKEEDALHKADKAYTKRANLDFYLYLVAVMIVALSIRLFIFEPVRVDGPSMMPTLLDGERMFVEKVSLWAEPPARGNIIICWYPNEKDTCVKRVIGLPGETVEVRWGSVYINGEALDESPYWNDFIFSDMAAYTVPEDCVFVMGDNRNVSKDSRAPDVGPIPFARIVGHARSVIWPLSNTRGL